MREPPSQVGMYLGKDLIHEMSSGIRKVDQILDKMERQNQLTSDGRAWLISAVDPFHDTDVTLAGYPDVLTAATVVQLVKQQIQITVPTTGPGAVTAGSNWDASIVLCPSLTGTTLQSSGVISATGQVTTVSTLSTMQGYGGLTVAAGPQGSALWPALGTGVNPPATSTTLSPSIYVKGSGRVIGMGFEVVNTTAEINKQGQVTTWRLPSDWTPAMFFNQNGVAGSDSTVACWFQRLPVATLANAQLLFGSRSWSAAEGAYVVARQNSANNPVMLPRFLQAAWTLNDLQSGTAETMIGNSFFGFGLAQNTTASDYLLPFDTSGAHFTGLSYATSLTVNVRWLFERIPAPNEADLVVLATPSAAYDPLALEIYTRCLRDMPSGVMLKENPLGEWFQSVISKVADWAPKIGTALSSIGIPGAGIIGNVVGNGASEIMRYLPKKREEEKKKPKPLPPLPTDRQLRISSTQKQPMPDSRSIVRK